MVKRTLQRDFLKTHLYPRADTILPHQSSKELSKNYITARGGEGVNNFVTYCYVHFVGEGVYNYVTADTNLRT